MFECRHRQNLQSSIDEFCHSVGVELEKILFVPASLGREHVRSFPSRFTVCGWNLWVRDGHLEKFQQRRRTIFATPILTEERVD